MRPNEEDLKQIKEFARREMQYETDNPFNATITGIRMWMKKNHLRIISFEEELEARIQIELTARNDYILEREIISGLQDILEENTQPPEAGEALPSEGEQD